MYIYTYIYILYNMAKIFSEWTTDFSGPTLNSRFIFSPSSALSMSPAIRQLPPGGRDQGCTAYRPVFC